LNSGALDRFANDVRRGLTSQPKSLPPKYFYDELGSKLFEAICCLPEYYLTRAEKEILREWADDIYVAASGARPLRFIELGSGSADKTRFLIEAALGRQGSLHYVPVDISEPSIDESCEKLLRDYPGLQITAHVADYSEELEGILDSLSGDFLNVVLLLGSNIGNFDPQELRQLLRRLARADALILGADLKKSPHRLVSAYNDALGVTAAFNLNILIRINRELGGDFDLSNFHHQALYDRERGRIEMHLVSRRRQQAHIKALSLSVKFEPGETIHTESSYKFDLDQLSELARGSGFSPEKVWLDRSSSFSLNLWVRS
jgi:dimethylhistidine N-methyltransferase